jgi:Dictyostelium (slime mold) repeat
MPNGVPAGGTNDVGFSWDGTTKTSVAVSGQVSNASLYSGCPFSGAPWTAHDLAIYGPGTYTVNPCCAPGSPGCSDTCNDPNSGLPVPTITFTVNDGEIGGHMLFNWSVNANINVVNVWAPFAPFGPSPLWSGGCGSNAPDTVWTWMSRDIDGDGLNGLAFVDGPFAGTGLAANFNLIPTCTPPAAGACDDGNACTDDGYNKNGQPGTICACTHTPVANGTTCSDGNACTTGDVCTNGICGGTAVVCTALDQCHTAGTCDPATGTCSNPTKANGTSCADADLCNGNETCQNGTCTAGTPVVCAAPAACKAAGVCQPATGTCTYANLADGTSCDDGLFCDGIDTCSGGTCTHSGNPCPTGTTCNETTDTCVPITTTCNANNVGAACDDNNVCTTNDKCVQGGNRNHPTFTCQGTAISCNDNNACTNDSCNPATGCVHTPVSCNDNNICTIDSCDPAVGCVHKAKCDDGNICTNDICNPVTGACTHVPKPKSVTMKGSLTSTYELANPIYNDEIQATFTVTNDGCIMYTSGSSMVKVSPGSLITITCAGTGPAPNYATLDGNPITIPDSYTCPDLDVNHKIHVTNMGKQGKGPGHDIDDFQLKASTNDSVF